MGEGQELRDDALCNETPQEKLVECTCGDNVFREGVHLPSCPARKPQEKTVPLEEMCKAAVAGKLKPDIDLLEKAIGTPWELFLLPDGSVKFKHTLEVSTTVGSDDFKEDCFALRAQIEETKKQTMLVIREHPVFLVTQSTLGPDQRGEMIANLKLAFRHLEDARMRVGKAIQAFDGGKSCYPR